MTLDRQPAAALEELRAAVRALESDAVERLPDEPDTECPESAAGAKGAEGAQEGRAARDPYAVARGIVLRQLTNSPKTRAQLRAALAKRDCPDDVAEAVLDRMGEVGLVDDAAYAALLVRSRAEQKGLARRALRAELRTKGIDDEVAADALTTVDDAAERRRARALVDRRLAQLHGLDITVQTRRLAGMLARKGYAGDVAYAVIRDALADAPEHRRD